MQIIMVVLEALEVEAFMLAAVEQVNQVKDTMVVVEVQTIMTSLVEAAVVPLVVQVETMVLVEVPKHLQ